MNRARANPLYREYPTEYGSWQGMIERCCHPTSKDYPRYGARGIKVCDRWRHSFTAFIEDMGTKPSPKHSIDRLDNNGDYEPGNCAWRTASEQARNRRSNRVIECFGRKQTLIEWSREFGVGRVLIVHRLRAGWSTEEAVTTPPSRSKNSRWRRTDGGKP